jgi:hypothetical protein
MKFLLHLGAGEASITASWHCGLWISRDNLWITALACGEVPVRLKMSVVPDPHIWARVLTFSKMWIG